jgi:hypothetical protein
MKERSLKGKNMNLESSRVFFGELQGFWWKGFAIWSKGRGLCLRLKGWGLIYK